MIQKFHIFNSLTNSVLLSISHSHLIQMSHTFNSVTNSTVLSRFTFSSISKVYKFTSFIWFHSLISFIVLHIQKCNKVNGLISFKFSSISIVYKFNSLFWFQSLISFNRPTYSKVQQIQYFNIVYIIYDSKVPYIQQSHKFSFIIYFTFSSHSNVPHIQ